MEKYLLQNNSIKEKPYKCVLVDPYEFWKYLMKDGVFHFLIDSYDSKRKELEQDSSKDSSLGD